MKSIGNGIPYFYYDVFARVLPGALAILLLISFGVPVVPRFVAAWFKDGSAVQAAVIPFALTGAGYAIGTAFETAGRFLVVGNIVGWQRRLAFIRALMQWDPPLSPYPYRNPKVSGQDVNRTFWAG